MTIPNQYLPVMPYIIVDDAVAFFDFTKNVFDAHEQLIVPGEDGRGIMHGEIKINDAVIMFAQSNEQWGTKTCGIFIYVEDVDSVYNKAIAHKATPLRKPEKQEYGYSGGFEDPFGNQWWICNND
ncbi:VOC family protein [Flavobacterium rhizosphaerae]|uniref:VOC family protein n=1 Tax=Flavobacterium rhizosphaerae TaxID=3163298 RepID=A0ABW8YVM9_9FLAO